MPSSVDTKNAAGVANYVKDRFQSMFPGEAPELLNPLFTDISNLFMGGHPDYQKNDLGYHDFEHTLQATVCMTQLLEVRHLAGAEPHLNARQTELAIASALLHDTGYLKQKSDLTGTGAKYTFIHVLRSCAFAASYLPTLGVSEYEIEGVLGAIRCTGPTSKISELHFHDTLERTIGCALSTADYLGQMAAADYPDELDILYGEFIESYEFFRTKPEKRMFKTAEDMKSKTPDFWRKIVLPKLENDFRAVYRFLASPYPHGPNRYIEAVEANISKIEQSLARVSA
jgi:hypothetical protein